MSVNSEHCYWGRCAFGWLFGYCMAFPVFASPRRTGHPLWPSQGAAQNACATGCAVQGAWRGLVADRHGREQKQDGSLLPELTAKLVLASNQIHAACLFVGMWEFAYIKTEKPSWLLPLPKFNCGFMIRNRSKITFNFMKRWCVS